MSTNHYNFKGLTDEQVLISAEKSGRNKLEFKKENGIIQAILSIVKEPMVLILLLASILYFITGDSANGIFLVSAIVLLSTISLYQESQSRNALDKLKELTKPTCKVIRNNEIQEIVSDDLVLGDYLVVDEGSSIAADGRIVVSNDFSVNESILTGESLAINKNEKDENNIILQGTSVASGHAVAIIEAIGNATRLGKIGKSIEQIVEEKTPLEIQIGNFVKKMVIAGSLVFILVWIIHFYHSRDFIGSLLKSLTLAMSVIPEEIPLAMTSFMALGSRRLMQLGIIVKQIKTVETLGSATVICTDKTGTITENSMSLSKVYTSDKNGIIEISSLHNEAEMKLIRIAMWASETAPFDTMEKAIHESYSQFYKEDERPQYSIIHEYPLGGKPPMMTHVFENKQGQRIIAAKGAPEAILAVCKHLSDVEKEQIVKIILTLSKEGQRLLGVAEGKLEGNDFPKEQQQFDFQFIGIVAFNDPPKKNIKEVLSRFYSAGIQVKIITGDNAETTGAIAKQVGFKGYDQAISGEELMALNDTDLVKIVEEKQVFTRMFPEAKLKIINALKANKEIVAMTGDGVNDGPALKASHIGIAMGKKGSEIAKQSASLVLVEDDLSKMVDAIAMGRRIYANLKKANRYIISIHIPIILTVFIPLALGWIYPTIFSPIHIIFLELIMGPTCSILFENEPIEKNAMTQKPRPFTSTFFSWKELNISIIQGLVITCAVLFMYWVSIRMGNSEEGTRTMVFLTLVSANISLTLINRSFYYSILQTFRFKNNLVPIITGITIVLTFCMLYIEPIQHFFEFERLNMFELILSIIAGICSVIWFEIVKWFRRNNTSYLRNSELKSV